MTQNETRIVPVVERVRFFLSKKKLIDLSDSALCRVLLTIMFFKTVLHVAPSSCSLQFEEMYESQVEPDFLRPLLSMTS